ncbi:hypothetical protein J6590_019235 [Homalodisca vitripennis]|nr:hypothetical protein J6590_019235 [Homalodisca vitripennis]
MAANVHAKYQTYTKTPSSQPQPLFMCSNYNNICLTRTDNVNLFLINLLHERKYLTLAQQQGPQ